MVVYTRIFQSRVIPEIQFVSWYAVTEPQPTQNLNAFCYRVENIPQSQYMPDLRYPRRQAI